MFGRIHLPRRGRHEGTAPTVVCILSFRFSFLIIHFALARLLPILQYVAGLAGEFAADGLEG